MQISHSLTESRPPESRVGASDPVSAALRELGEVREVVLERLTEFSAATLLKWNELEAEIENKLECLETRLAGTGETAVEAAVARINELGRAIQDLVESHLHCPARALMSTSLRTCSPEDSLERAAQLLWEGDCGALPVVDTSGRLVAMITDRDVCMAVYFRGCAPSDGLVRDAMSNRVYTCSPDDAVERICEIIGEHRVRRVPVSDAEGHLIGIVSLADVVHHLNGLPAAHPCRQLLVATMAAVCDRHLPRSLESTHPLSGAAA